MQTSSQASAASATENCVKKQAKGATHVNFNIDSGEINERKKNYLTAKYGQHQMSLIKKRLRVEMWMCEQLQTLYTDEDGVQSPEIEIDLDVLLDIEGEDQRKEWLRNKLHEAKKSKDHVDKFVGEVLERARTL